MPAPPVSVPASLSAIASRLSEGAALVGALLYGLGTFRISGTLSDLHLSTPQVLSNFRQTDVLMSGSGVLASHAATTCLLGIVIALFLSPRMLEQVNAVFTRERRLTPLRWALVMAACAAFVLLSRYWERLVFVAIVLVVAAARWVTRTAASRTSLFALLVAGVASIGFLGSYLSPPPLMTASVVRGDERIEGPYVGKGSNNEILIGVRDDDGTYDLQVIGGKASAPAERLVVHPAKDRTYRTVLFQILDGWLRIGHHNT